MNKFIKLQLAVRGLEAIAEFRKELQTVTTQAEGSPGWEDGKVVELVIPKLTLPLLEVSPSWQAVKAHEKFVQSAKTGLSTLLTEREDEYRKILKDA